jgi:hypothetical protein
MSLETQDTKQETSIANLNLYQAWLDERQKNRVLESDKALILKAAKELLEAVDKIATDCYGRPTQMMLIAREAKDKYLKQIN